jgi:hypothetical protein
MYLLYASFLYKYMVKSLYSLGIESGAGELCVLYSEAPGSFSVDSTFVLSKLMREK